jgi:hypothetical protein
VGRMMRSFVVVVVATLALAVAACEGSPGAGDASPTPRAQATSPPVARPSQTPASTAVVTPGPVVSPPVTPTVMATPPTVAPSPTPTVPPGRVEQLAPIESVAVTATGGTAVARITSGLPSGCAVYSRAVVTRTGATVRVDVYNHLPTGQVACTAIYGMVTNDVDLGGGFTVGSTYTVDVNGTRQTFMAR